LNDKDITVYKGIDIGINSDIDLRTKALILVLTQILTLLLIWV